MVIEQKRIPDEMISRIAVSLASLRSKNYTTQEPGKGEVLKQFIFGDEFQEHLNELLMATKAAAAKVRQRDWIHERTLSLSHATHVYNQRNATNLSLDEFSIKWSNRHGDDAVVFINGSVQRVVCYPELE